MEARRANSPATAFPTIILVLSLFTSHYLVTGDELSLDVSQSPKLQISPALMVENSPGSKPGTKVLCERVQIHGLPRLKNLDKFANTVVVNISLVNPGVRLPNVEVCFHRNQTRGVGMCPQGMWTKLTKGSLVKSVSPFDHRFIDFRIRGSSRQTLEVSLHEEFYLYRVVLLVLGILLMSVASYLSKSLVFCYGSTMAIGIILVILMVLFQGMKLLPTGRKNSLAIFISGSLIGLGSFFHGYVSAMLRSILAEIGIGEDMYFPLFVFLLVLLAIAGAWFGFWVVRKLVLTEDGSIDIGTSHFIAWSLRLVASAMILQSTKDHVLAAEAWVGGIVVSSILRSICHLKFVCLICKKSSRMARNICGIVSDWYTPPFEESYHSRTPSRPQTAATHQGSSSRSPRRLSDSDTFYSTFHNTPERRKVSKEDWDELTQQTTKKALEELVGSPDFGRWAVAHADRITLAPERATTDKQRRWYHWF